jgi:hypothetical protein
MPGLFLSAIVLPLFLAGFTASKTAIPFIVGYNWDSTFADLDVLVLGENAWQITHAWLGFRWVGVLEWAYTFGWGLVFLVGSSLVAIHAQRRDLATFFTAMFLTWMIGGFVVAYGFSAAGPVFVHLVEPTSGTRFQELRETLAGNLAPEGLLRTTQSYLESSLHDHTAYKGGGISAMPSMHIGAASIFVLATRRSSLFLPSIAFWIVIFVLSAYFGYHYWIDAIPAAAIAWLSWAAAESYYKQTASAFPVPQLSPV